MGGSYGTRDGQFDEAVAVAVDTSGNVYVAENGNNRVQKFDSSGKFLAKWGNYGWDAGGQFDYPYGIATDSSGNISMWQTRTTTASRSSGRL